MECRVCQSHRTKILTTLKKVPSSAQLFLDEKSSIVEDAINLIIEQCEDCGHVQSGNLPVNYYRDVITASNLSETISKERVNCINNIIQKFNIPKIKILEIGSHKGAMVKLINDKITKNVVGIEHSEESVRFAKKNNINIIQGYVGEENKINLTQKFNLALCYNFLEHMPYPRKFLAELKIYLEENALVYMTVPSLNFIEKTSCIHEFIADHLSYFSKESLFKLFSSSNFEVLECNYIHNDNDLEILAKYHNPPKVSLNLNEYNSLITKFNQILDLSSAISDSVIIWGAGHRSLTFISQANYHLIDFIVDSAKFKQNKYTPVTRKLILSPEMLKDKHNSTLIINLPGIYGDEVIANLDQVVLDNMKYIFNIVGNDIQKFK